MKHQDLKKIWDVTSGACHFCAVQTTFDHYGTKADLLSGWQVDHVIPLAKGGLSAPANYLCICLRCNTAKSKRTGRSLRRLLRVWPCGESAVLPQV
jgi:5-methylcytosine-specific restriction endonuclease McrA